jgi:hypothetical protein
VVVSWGKRNAVVPMPIRPTARRERGSGSGIEADILRIFLGGRKIGSWEVAYDESMILN